MFGLVLCYLPSIMVHHVTITQGRGAVAGLAFADSDGKRAQCTSVRLYSPKLPCCHHTTPTVRVHDLSFDGGRGGNQSDPKPYITAPWMTNTTASLLDNYAPEELPLIVMTAFSICIRPSYLCSLLWV